MTTGERIKAARKKAGMTQAELAAKLDVPFQSISQWERDIRKPKYETLERIATALRTSTGALLGTGSKNQLKYKVIQWASRKDARLEMSIDSELLETIKIFAEHDGLTLEDEVEKLLREYSDILIEQEATETIDTTGLT